MNRFACTARLTKDLDVRYTNDNKAIVKFDIAVNRRFKREGESDADFFSCVAFGKTAEAMEKLSITKGTKLLIEGELRNNNYEKDGVKHYSNQIIVDNFEFCESKNSQQNPPASSGNDFMPIEDDIDSLPFG